MAKKSKTVTYRRAELIGQDGNFLTEPLETLIKKALSSDNVPSPVRMDYGIEGQATHLLLHSKENNMPFYRAGCLCGRISVYDDESMVPLVDSEFNKDTGEVFIEQAEPLDSKNKRRKLEQQAHYFAVKGNHVAIMASSSNGIDMVEDFFTRLIQDMSGILESISVKLVNLPTQQAMKLIKEQPVRSVSFSSPSYTLSNPSHVGNEEAVASGTGNKTVRQMYSEKSVVRAILDAIAYTRKKTVPDYEDDKDFDGLCVAVEFSCKNRKDEAGRQVVKDLARHIGGIEGLSPVLKLSGKSVITKDMLTIKDTISVEGVGKNLNHHLAISAVAEWLVKQIEEGKVTDE